MRGSDPKQDAVFSYVSPEERVPADHPLRRIRTLVDGVLKEMSPQFGKLYSEVGRPSIAPERLLRALLLQIFYSVRSERLLRSILVIRSRTNQIEDLLPVAETILSRLAQIQPGQIAFTSWGNR